VNELRNRENSSGWTAQYCCQAHVQLLLDLDQKSHLQDRAMRDCRAPHAASACVAIVLL